MKGETQRRQAYEALLGKVSYPEELPISARAAEIVAAIRAHPVVIVAGETGSGKTTQLPKMLLQAGYGGRGRIACTQPRRVAALSVSRRIAEELGVQWGREVGARIRFTDQTAPQTVIKMMTDGMLLSEVQSDRRLSGYDAVIIDEAHERSLNIDFLLGYLNLLRQRRPDLRILITSATIDTASFSKAFGDAPVIEVSGRTYPVETVYAPIDELLEDSGEFTYIEAAARAIEEIVAQNQPGDVLVFLPGERDIRDLGQLLEGRTLGRAEVLPLFGRLSNADQQRIFAPIQARKIILATNIAETSITIPGIRYVIDTGLARMSRYSAHTRTQRLPVEPISQSSANQRKGRAGRVRDGVCIRLYSEKDFLSRPEFTAPEIQRANLAAVILRMIAFRIGEMDTFPFIDPPQERAVRGGYQLLQDLGALDEQRQLTPLGRKIAHLPVDPTVARMLLEADREGALREVLVIAAGLSIQDPRERPADAREAAEREHRRFNHESSDFMTLLNIWNAFHDETERLSHGQLRRFCKRHYLSYIRMREWSDIHDQLLRVLNDLGELRINSLPAPYHSIHRSLLVGLLSNVAQRDTGNHYIATRNRRVMLFPGSVLFDSKSAKDERKKNKGSLKPSAVSGKRTPAWIMCAEWMETARLYARTAAAIEPQWIVALGRHLCESSFTDPGYDERSERVLVRERLRLYGLEVASQRIDYGRVDAAAATEIFIRSALVGDQLRTSFRFMEENRRVRERVEDLKTRLRSAGAWSLDEALYHFYAQHLSGISSVHDLQRLIRREWNGDDARLTISEAQLLAEVEAQEAMERFPDRAALGGGLQVPVEYAYTPGEARDGATLKIPVSQFAQVDPRLLDWAVPGYIEEKVNALLRGLPKDLRRQLFPIQDKAIELCRLIKPSPQPLTSTLASLILERYGVRIMPDQWDESVIPEYLRARIEVVDTQDRVIAEGRDWNVVANAYRERVREESRKGTGHDRLAIWQQASARIEKHHLAGWNFEDLPESIVIGDLAGVPLVAWPGLRIDDDGGVSLILFRNGEDAEAATRRGFRRLCVDALGKDLAWLHKDLRKELKRVRLIAGTLVTPEVLEQSAAACMEDYLFEVEAVRPLRRAVHDAVMEQARERSKGIVQKLVDALEAALEARHALVATGKTTPLVADGLAALFDARFPAGVPYAQLRHYPRYLKALAKRAERARTNPARDAARWKEVAPFAAALAKFAPADPRHPQLRWMIEEFKVSQFAQELGTAVKVSSKRLEELLREAPSAGKPAAQ